MAGGQEEERLARDVVAMVRTWAGRRKAASADQGATAGRPYISASPDRRVFASPSSLPHLAIKFCGGCNPVIDRGPLARSIRENLRGLVHWVPAEEETDLLLIICGCLTACAEQPGVTDPAAEYLVIGGESFSPIKTGGRYGAQGQDIDCQAGSRRA